MTSLSAPLGTEPELRAESDSDGLAPRVLVLGATGYIGGRLTPRLVNAGYRVRILTRSAQRIESFPRLLLLRAEMKLPGRAAASSPA